MEQAIENSVGDNNSNTKIVHNGSYGKRKTSNVVPTTSHECIRAHGIVSLLNESEPDKIQFCKDGRFYKIPERLAKDIINQKKIPLCLNHNKNKKIGVVDRFFICETKNSKNNKPHKCLKAHYTITDGNFISSLRNIVSRRAKINNYKIYSSDGFLADEVPRKKSSETDIDINARFALLNRLPGLSLHHTDEKQGYSVTELSLCLAGARDATVTLDAELINDSNMPTELNSKIESDFTADLAALVSCGSSSILHEAIKDTQLAGAKDFTHFQYAFTNDNSNNTEGDR